MTYPSLQRQRRQHLLAAAEHLQRHDPILGGLMTQVGRFQLKLEPDRYSMLVRSILSQQISTLAARAIRLRLEALAQGQGLVPQAISALTDDQLRSAGLSGQKVNYLRDLTEFVETGRLQLQRLHRHPDSEVIAELVQVKGIGHWTAQMFLMFSLGRLDVFPHDDLGIRSSLRTLYQLPELPDKARSLEIAAPWRPYATIASWYVWRLADLKSNPTMDASKYPV